MPELRIHLAGRTLAMLVATGVGLWAIIRLPGVLALAFLALMVSATLAPAVDRLHARGLPRILAVLLVFAFFAGVLALFLLIAFPVVLEQAQALSRSLPAYGEAWRTALDRITALSSRWGIPAPARWSEQLAVWLSQQLSSWAQATVSLTVNALNALFSVGLVLLGSVYLLLDAPALHAGFVRLFPLRYRPLVESQWPQLSHRLGAYMRGQLLSMTALALLLALGLSLIGLPFAGLIAVVAGLADLIPMLGSVLGVTLATLVALTVDWHLLPLVWAVFLGANFLQGNVLGPMIFARTVQIPPVVTLVALLVGAQLLGLMGALLAVPVASLAVLLVENLWMPAMDAPHREDRRGRGGPQDACEGCARGRSRSGRAAHRTSCGSGRRGCRP